MKLEEGMYVRTKDGEMFILDKIEDNHLIPRYVHIPYIIIEEDVKKASNNIIDLIEVGDYVNGFKVSKIEKYDTNTIIKIGNSTFNVLEGEKIYTPSYDNNNGYEKIEKLKSIVTKEMVSSVEYRMETD